VLSPKRRELNLQNGKTNQLREIFHKKHIFQQIIYRTRLVRAASDRSAALASSALPWSTMEGSLIVLRPAKRGDLLQTADANTT
jgi:hypothetical protein